MPWVWGESPGNAILALRNPSGVSVLVTGLTKPLSEREKVFCCICPSPDWLLFCCDLVRNHRIAVTVSRGTYFSPV